MTAEANRLSSCCVIGIMDQLWFHQVVFFSEPNMNASFPCPAQIPQFPAEEDEELSSSPESCPTPTTLSAVDETNKERQRLTRASSVLITPMERKVWRSFSSSPSSHGRPRKRSVEPRKTGLLQKSMSCRSLEDLEMEEVRGFMDLGFIFKREHLSPRIVSVVPGLQRLAAEGPPPPPPPRPQQQEEQSDETTDEEEGEVPMPMPQARPYLSEAWLIRRPDSPLLNLRVPRASPAAEMKRHLRYWARTVAYVIEQES